MRILQVTHTFLPNHIGGRETHVYHLCRTLLGKNQDIEILTTGDMAHDVANRYKGIPVQRFRAVTVRLSNAPTRLVYRVCPGMFFRILHERLDLLHAHDYGHFTTDIAALACLIKRVPFVMTIHGIKPPTLFTRLLMGIYDLTVGHMTLRVAKRIIVVSKQQLLDIAAKRLTDERILSKVILIPNGVTAGDTEVATGGLFRSHFSIDEREKMVLGVGRLIKRKGFHRLIEIGAELLKHVGRVKIVIVGPDGGQMSELQSMARNQDMERHVLITGSVSRGLLQGAIVDADVVVIPSEYEGLPTLLLEAMASGKPIVATKTGGMPEVVTNLESGMLVENESKAILEGVIAVLSRPELAARLGSNAREIAKGYGWDRVSDRTLRVYREAMDRR